MSSERVTASAIAPAADRPANKAPIFLKEAVIYSALTFCAGGIGFATQSIFSRYLAAGEFGTLTTTLGFIALLVVPLAAVNQTLTHYLARYHANDRHEEIEQFRMLAFQVLKLTAFAAGFLISLMLLVVPLIFSFGRPLLECLALLGVLGYLGTTLSSALCLGLNRFRLWGILLIAADTIRLCLAALLTPRLPWAETGMALTAFAGLITTIPLFTKRKWLATTRQALQIIFQRDFLLHLGASLSVMLALFCFASGDQIIARHSFRPALAHSFDLRGYDSYQAAGMMGRALLGGCAPALAVLFTQVSRLRSIDLSWLAFLALLRRREHMQVLTMKALELLFLYTGVLFCGAVGMFMLRSSLIYLFQGYVNADAAYFLLLFARAMVPIGMIQVVAVLCLSSRLIPECFILGFAGISYAAGLYFLGRSPGMLLSCMYREACLVLVWMACVAAARRLRGAHQA